ADQVSLVAVACQAVDDLLRVEVDPRVVELYVVPTSGHGRLRDCGRRFRQVLDDVLRKAVGLGRVGLVGRSAAGAWCRGLTTHVAYQRKFEDRSLAATVAGDAPKARSPPMHLRKSPASKRQPGSFSGEEGLTYRCARWPFPCPRGRAVLRPSCRRR